MTGIDILIITIGLLIVLAAFVYADWEDWDDQRRLERRVHVNLYRQGGEWWS